MLLEQGRRETSHRGNSGRGEGTNLAEDTHSLCQQQHDIAAHLAPGDVLNAHCAETPLHVDAAAVAVAVPDAYQPAVCSLAACASAALPWRLGGAWVPVAAPRQQHPVALSALERHRALPSCVARLQQHGPFAVAVLAWAPLRRDLQQDRCLRKHHLSIRPFQRVPVSPHQQQVPQPGDACLSRRESQRESVYLMWL